MIAAVFANTNSLGIKIRGLEAFYTLCGGTADSDTIGDGLDGVTITQSSSNLSSSQVLDKFTVQEKVVPLMKAIKTKEPGVMVSIFAYLSELVADNSRWLPSKFSDRLAKSSTRTFLPWRPCQFFGDLP